MRDETRRFLTPAETMKVFGLSRSSLYRALKAGTIPSVRIGRLLRIPKVALEGNVLPLPSGAGEKGE